MVNVRQQPELSDISRFDACTFRLISRQFMYYDYPIEQLARSATTQFQTGFARMTVHLIPEFHDAVLEPSAEGLKILGASEVALTMPGKIIRQIHADDVQLNEPRVRLVYDKELREPVMWARASVEYDYAEAVVQDLVGRGAEIREVDRQLPHPVKSLPRFRTATLISVCGSVTMRPFLPPIALAIGT
jgi:hypothetical protein